MRFRSFICALWLTVGFTGQTSVVTAQIDTTVFAPLGATWYYSGSSSGPPWLVNPLYASFLVEKDSFLLGYHARVIGCYVNVENQLIRVDSLTKYVATVGNKVYYKVGDEFVLLYDFGAQVGDTISSRVEDFGLSLGCGSDFSEGAFDFRYVIDSIGTLEIDEDTLRVQYVNSIYQFPGSNWVFWDPILERIGPLGFGSWWWGQGEGCIFESGFLRCYVDDVMSWRSSYFHGPTPCDFTSTEIVEEQEPFKVYPNPVVEEIVVSLREDYFSLLTNPRIHIMDILGRLMISCPLTESLQQVGLNGLPAGIYILTVESKGVVIWSQKLMKW